MHFEAVFGHVLKVWRLAALVALGLVVAGKGLAETPPATPRVIEALEWRAPLSWSIPGRPTDRASGGRAAHGPVRGAAVRAGRGGRDPAATARTTSTWRGVLKPAYSIRLVLVAHEPERRGLDPVQLGPAR